MERLRDGLQRQLNFVVRSLDAYQAGHKDEAIRIAVAIRVLLHNTARSASILAQMGREDVRLLSTCNSRMDPKMPETLENTHFYFGLGVLQLGPAGVEFVPPTGEPLPTHFMPSLSWWEQVVWIPQYGMHVRRKDLVLAAANKDGGAHHDPELPAFYKALADKPFGPMGMFAPGPLRPEEVHLELIRILGIELRDSPALWQL